ncbi:MAG: sigma-70 family RNA polymerase sigma factor [Defluviitaleaceae bacterium]|nr:sigma-70 family RNA polymerase sigma factor [Defluviitaleaceae bacterium]
MDYKNKDNEYLAGLAVGGDTEAQEALFRRFKGHVVVLARSYFIMGGDREDLVQEGMIGLYKAIKQFDPKRNASFAGFATVCIKNQMLDAIKIAARPKHSPLNSYVPIDGENPEIAGIADYGQEPDTLLINREEIENLRQIAQSLLSKLEYQILSYYLEGMSYSEIASVTERTVKSVENALLRIRRKVLGRIV